MDSSENDTTSSDIDRLPVSVRASVSPYLAAGFLSLFAVSFLLYLELDIYAVIFAAIAFVAIFLLAITDRLVFDGRRIRRTGLVYRLAARAAGVRDRLKLSDIEQVDTQIFRGLRRGGRVLLRFRTEIRGKETSFVVFSGGKRYRKFIVAVLNRLEPDVLDARSMELRSYLANPDEIRLRANEAQIPPSEVIEPSLLIDAARSGRSRTNPPAVNAETGKLRRLGNELRLSGSLVRALEAFRRALLSAPSDAWLLFDSARCLYSYSGAKRDVRLERRALALMRLAERRAGRDAELLSLIGESYSQMGDWTRAAAVFRRISEEAGETFRSLRGQAEIALREGKIAHVIHNFAAANRVSPIPSLRRWTQTEVDYFSRLNEDEEYMELEVSRVNLLDSLARTRRSALRITFIGLVMIMVGVLIDDGLIANIGWAVAFLAISLWIAMRIGRRMLEARIPFELVETDRT